MDSTNPAWLALWARLRSRRLAAVVAIAALIPLWIVLGPIGLLVGFFLALAAIVYLRGFRCPRCGHPIVGAKLQSFVERCVGCHLLIFGHPADADALIAADSDALTMSPHMRRFIAAYELISGIALIILTAFSAGTWWQRTLLEGMAAASIAAGFWLWRDDSRGYSASRSLQWAQLIRIQSPWLSYLTSSGVFLDLYHTNGGAGIAPGFSSSVRIWLMPGEPFGVAVNLWAAALLLILMHARPRAAFAGVPASERLPEVAAPIT
jgi:hypothetical protein